MPGYLIDTAAWHRDQQQSGNTHHCTRCQGCLCTERGGNAEKHRWRYRRTEETGERMDRKRAPQAALLDAVGQQRVIGRVVNAIGQARHGHCYQQHRIAGADRQQQETEAAQQQPCLEHLARTVVVDGIAQRCLHQGRDDVEHRQGYAKLDEPHAQQAREYG
ncbi:hypothetical protein D3C81_1248920 [compost metagenome]